MSINDGCKLVKIQEAVNEINKAISKPSYASIVGDQGHNVNNKALEERGNLVKHLDKSMAKQQEPKMKEKKKMKDDRTVIIRKPLDRNIKSSRDIRRELNKNSKEFYLGNAEQQLQGQY